MLGPATLPLLWSDPVRVETDNWPFYPAAGLGVFVDSAAGLPLVIGHDSANDGWRATFRAIPDRHAALVILTNSTNGWRFFQPTNPIVCAWYASHGAPYAPPPGA